MTTRRPTVTEIRWARPSPETSTTCTGMRAGTVTVGGLARSPRSVNTAGTRAATTGSERDGRPFGAAGGRDASVGGAVASGAEATGRGLADAGADRAVRSSSLPHPAAHSARATAPNRLRSRPRRADNRPGEKAADDTMPPSSPIVRRALVEYDAAQRRLWLCGQRCHHGATGALLALAALGALTTSAARPRGLATMLAAGSLLMAHDWGDRARWFERGAQH
jgi:hypothetical protein